jgi:hypothetical protein
MNNENMAATNLVAVATVVEVEAIVVATICIYICIAHD